MCAILCLIVSSMIAWDEGDFFFEVVVIAVFLNIEEMDSVLPL